MVLEQIVRKDLNNILGEEALGSVIEQIHFCYGDGQNEPGEYVYEANDKYFYVAVGDRGGIEECIESENVEQVLYKLYSNITFREATKYALQNMKKGKDWRRNLFTAQLDLLKTINSHFYQDRLQEINAILSENPYSDDE